MATNRATDDVPVYGHRFGGDYGPEGSRVALEKSLARQVDGLECDIILSRDETDGDWKALHTHFSLNHENDGPKV